MLSKLLCGAILASAAAGASAQTLEFQLHGLQLPRSERDAKLREQFMQAVLDLVDNKLGAQPSSDTARLDAELNTAYQKVMNTPSSQEDAPNRIGDSTIDRTEVRKVERLWLVYRDAFIAFAATLRSGPDTVEPLLIGQRIDELNKVAREM